MTSYIALLRGVNVGGHKRIAMADLRALVTELGFAGPRTLLQSGNLVFESDTRAPAQLERRLEAGCRDGLGMDVDFFVRSAREWAAVVTCNPFPDEAEHDPGHLLVMLLKKPAGSSSAKRLQEAIAGREIVRARGRELYITYPDGIGRSRLTNAVIEKHLGTRGTARNWNTVRKLAAAVDV
jgi:uncharacterized protein (DUF1697 family)